MKKNQVKKVIAVSIIAYSFLMQPIISVVSFTPPGPDWIYWLKTDFTHPIDLFSDWNATQGFRDRQNTTRLDALTNDGYEVQPARLYMNDTINEAQLLNHLEKMYLFKDCCDFDMVRLIRILYFDNNKTEMGFQVLSNDTKYQICDAFGKAKYWYTEPNGGKQIFYTENHQILYHSTEMLVGQLFPNSTFVNSGMTGMEHYEHALPLVKRWLDWKAQFGFAEWHSNTYYKETITALVNLVDFANDSEVVTKAAMVLDLMAFGFACNFYDGIYATSMGRTYDSSKTGTLTDSISEVAWIMLGIGEHRSGSFNMASIALATSDNYAPPPILEELAANATDFIEHKERNSINMADGPKYDLKYTEEDMMLWWSMSGPLYKETIIETLRMMNEYLLDSDLVYGPQLLMDYISTAAFFRGITLEQYSELIEQITRGVCLESANIYTYRTPFYQLSGAQDHKKGMNSMQEHIWQATIDNEVYVHTSCPGAVTHGMNQRWDGGWRPRATFYKNVGIIQYDRESMPLEAELVMFFLRIIAEVDPHYLHAYFPKDSFDEWSEYNGWYFGKKGDSYIAFYSYKPTWWANDYELRSHGLKNGYICEMGSIDEFNSFENFTSLIKLASLQVIPQALGYSITYDSPSQGIINVAWDGPMQVNSANVDIGPYPRFDNPYCTQEFATKTTIIEFNNSRLELDFSNGIRNYTASL